MIKIADVKDCCGCLACASKCPEKCIDIRTDGEGFWYPEVSKSGCVDCGSCERACPALQKHEGKTNPAAFAAYFKDERVRQNSSSGGVFTVAARHILDKGGVVFGAAFDGCHNVVHSYTEHKDGLERLRGSKYVQSRTGECYNEAESFLKQGRTVLFSGTPCQVAGLKCYLGKEYDNLFCADLICHGVPSPKVWRKYLEYHEKRAGAQVTGVNFRSKIKGWKKFCMALWFSDKKVYNNDLYRDLFLKSFLQDISLRPSCYDCKFKILSRESDLTLADFWGVETILPSMSDDRGISLVLIHSDKGQALFKAISDKIIFCEADLNRAVDFNQAAVKSAFKNPKRDLFFKDLDSLPFNILIKKHCKSDIISYANRAIRSAKTKIRRLAPHRHKGDLNNV